MQQDTRQKSLGPHMSTTNNLIFARLGKKYCRVNENGNLPCRVIRARTSIKGKNSDRPVNHAVRNAVTFCIPPHSLSATGPISPHTSRWSKQAVTSNSLTRKSRAGQGGGVTPNPKLKSGHAMIGAAPYFFFFFFLFLTDS